MKKILLAAICLGFSVAGFSQTDTSLNAYTGKYIFPEGSKASDATVTIENGQLEISSSIGSASLAREKNDSFTMTDYDGTVDFIRDSITQKIVKVHIQVSSAEIDVEGDKENDSNQQNSQQLSILNAKACITDNSKYALRMFPKK